MNGDDAILIELDREMVDQIAIQSMKCLVESFEEDMEMRKIGEAPCGFFHKDKRKDIAEIKRHIDALKIVLNYFGEGK